MSEENRPIDLEKIKEEATKENSLPDKSKWTDRDEVYFQYGILKGKEEEREKWKKEEKKWINLTEVLAIKNKNLEDRVKTYQDLVKG